MDFGSTWPALLIVIGLIMFLQHNASADGHVPREYGAGTPPAGSRCHPRYPHATAGGNAAAGSASRLNHAGRELEQNPNDPEVHNG